MHNYTLAKVFYTIQEVSVSFDCSVIFLYIGEPDWIIHLNVEAKDSFGMVNCIWHFLKSYNIIGKFYYTVEPQLSNASFSE